MAYRSSLFRLGLALLLSLGACAEAEWPGIDADAGRPDSAPITNLPDGGGPSPGEADARPFPADPDASTSLPDAAPPPDARPAARSVTLSHSTSNAITPRNSVACLNGAQTAHVDNRYFRLFDLPAMGVTGPLVVSSVQFGVQSASTFLGSQPVQVALHTLTGPFRLANLTTLTTVDVSLPNQTLSLMNVPITATVPAGATLIAELHAPDGSAANHVLLVGSNAAGQTGPTYIQATGCGVAEPVDFATLMDANGEPLDRVHFVLSVTGTTAP